MHPHSRRPLRLALRALALPLALATAPATADTGVSDERVSLPEGPGSLEGVGENVEVSGATGLMSHRVAIAVPAGVRGMQPDLDLRYSSGGGSGLLGMGWDLMVPSIERRTVRGLPVYDTTDTIAANGSEQLVRVSGGDDAVYRARFEKAFVRYAWHDAADGARGWWTAEYPDGRIGTFGATADGTTVASAQVAGEAGTFRWHLVDLRDRYGNALRWTYTASGTTVVPLRVAWGYSGDTPRYEATFGYEARPDVVSDGKPGFDERLPQRLNRIFVRVDGTSLRRYELSYEATEASGGLSRLAEVVTIGASGGTYPIIHRFGYSGVRTPIVTTYGTSLGLDLATGDTTLIDLNGDAVPDIVDSTQPGALRLFLGDATTQSFTATTSAVATQTSHDLSAAAVDVLDVDGDGFADLLNAASGQLLRNTGAGDFEAPTSLWSAGDGGLPADFTAADGALKSVRFMDVDGDKRVDVIRSQGADAANTTSVYRNTGVGAYTLLAGTEDIGAGFDSDTLELQDMNGDGLLDPVQVTTSSVRYRLNLGRGHWSAWTTVGGFDFTDQERVDADLEDMDGDALADLVLVAGNTVTIWRNQGGAGFAAPKTFTSADVDGEIPAKGDSTVLYADMNGNGSTDVVWVGTSGAVTSLDLYPERPNLLTRIENGLGRRVEVDYAASTALRAADAAAGAPWAHALPYPMTVVAETRESDAFSGDVAISQYSYRDGYYDGVEKAFRGYGAATQTLPGDAWHANGSTEWTYDVGDTDAYRAGLMTQQVARSEASIVTVTRVTYEDCPVAGVGTTSPAVRYLCETTREEEHREGSENPADWKTTEVRLSWDGYGNAVRRSELGVVGTCDACTGSGYTGTPCGSQCLGDERYTDTAWITPDTNGDRWQLRLPAQERVYGVAGSSGPADSTYAETRTYYDGAAFEGLPLGQATHGTPARVTVRLDAAGATATTLRQKVDAKGNVTEALLPAAGGTTDGLRRWTWDATGLHPVMSEVLVSGRTLRRTYVWDPLHDKPTEASAWAVEGQATSAGTLHVAYDEFGRTERIVRPGASLDAPSEQYTYLLDEPVSRVVSAKRSNPDAAVDVIAASCVDGKGRVVSEQRRLSDTRWLTQAVKAFDAQGQERGTYLPFETPVGACATALPDDATATQHVTDGVGRRVLTLEPEGALGVPTWATRYLPLVTERWDPEDNRIDSPHAETPEVTRTNGLGQVIAVERLLAAGGTPLVHRLSYDALGNLVSVRDPEGFTTTQTFDFAGRVVATQDPDRGTRQYVRDDAGRVTRETDATGAVTRRTYDGLGRLVAQWPEGDEAAMATWRYDVAPAGCAECTHTAGQVAEMEYPGGRDRVGYDAMGRILWQERVVDGLPMVRRTTWDHLGRRVAETFPSGLEVAWTLDGADRVTAIPGFVTSVTYADRGLATDVVLANGVSTAYEYDNRMRTQGITTTGPAGVVLAYGYERDRMGHVTRVVDGRADDGHPLGGREFAYDALYRLTEAVMDPGHATLEETLAVAVDGAERVTSMSPVGTLTYTGRRVTAAGGVAYGWDAAGRLVSRGDDAFVWNHLGQLVGASTPGRAVKEAQYTYDAVGQRVVEREDGVRTLTPWPDVAVRSGVAVVDLELLGSRAVRIAQPSYMTTALSDVAPVIGPDAAVTADGDGLITAGDGWIAVAVNAGVLKGTEASATEDLLDASNTRLLDGLEDRVTFEHYGLNGVIGAVTGATGAVVARADLSPFGSVRYASGDADERGYTGKERDATGLIYFGARYYDPAIARWISPDPEFAVLEPSHATRIGEATSVYGFVGANPVTLQDPDGRLGDEQDGVALPVPQNNGADDDWIERELRRHFDALAQNQRPDPLDDEEDSDIEELFESGSPDDGPEYEEDELDLDEAMSDHASQHGVNVRQAQLIQQNQALNRAPSGFMRVNGNGQLMANQRFRQMMAVRVNPRLVNARQGWQPDEQNGHQRSNSQSSSSSSSGQIHPQVQELIKNAMFHDSL